MALGARRSSNPLFAAVIICIAALFLFVGASAGSTGSWDFSARIPSGDGPVVAARAGDLALYLRNVNGTILASVDEDASSEASLSDLAAGQALVVWTAPVAGGGQEVVGVARSDTASVSVLLSDGSTTTVQLDSLNAFSYTNDRARVLDVQAEDASGSTVGEIAVPPTGPSCSQSICRVLATGSAAAVSTTAGTVPLYGMFSVPRTVGAKNAVVNFGGANTLSRVNPKTLMPVGKTLKLPDYFWAQAFSPDGTHLLGSTNQNGLTIIDLKSLTLNAKLKARLDADLGSATVRSSAWPTARRVLVVAQRMSEPYQRNVVSRTLLGIDPADGSIVWKRELTNKLSLFSAKTVGSKLVLLLGNSSQSHHHSKETVVVASADGQVHTSVATIPNTKSGFNQGTLVAVSGASPAAYIVAAGTVFSIDLNNAQATPHSIAPPKNAPNTSLAVSGGYGGASPLGDKLVVGGGVFPLPNGLSRAGLYLVDPSTWTTRLIDSNASRFITRGTTLIAFTTAPFFIPAANSLTKGPGTGITIYNQDGTRLYHLYGERKFTDVGLTPSFAYAFAPTRTSAKHGLPSSFLVQNGQRLLFDPATGKSLGQMAATFSSPRLFYPGAPLSNG